MNKDGKLEQMIEGKEQHFSNQRFLNKVKKYGVKLGFTGLHGGATLYVALKGSSMPKSDKMVILGALGYFILPFDVVADLLPVIGLSDDLFLLTAALTKVSMRIDDDMKQEAHVLLKNMFGNRYEYEDEMVIKDIE